MTRAWLVLLLLTATLAAGAQAASAAPPTLTDEYFNTVLYDVGSPPAISCQDNPDGGAQVSFRLSGNSVNSYGPYRGPWGDKLEFRLSPPVRVGYERDVLAASGEFTIESPAGAVSGTLRLDPSATGPATNVAGATCDEYVAYVIAGLRYTATIITPDGVFVDRGRASFNLYRQSPRNPIYDVSHSFTSDLAAPEQNESALFGPRVPGGSFSAMSANTKRASPFTLFAPATVRKVYAYLDGKGATSGSQTIRAVLYRNAGGLPAAYVTRSFDFSVPAGMSGRWVPLYLAPTAQLGPGVYWIGIQSSTTHGVARFAWNSKPGSRRFNVDTFADGASNPFGSALVDDQQLSIFAAGSY